MKLTAIIYPVHRKPLNVAADKNVRALMSAGTCSPVARKWGYWRSAE